MATSTQEILSALDGIRKVQFLRNLCIAPLAVVFLVAVCLPIASWQGSALGTAWQLFTYVAIAGFLLSFGLDWKLSFFKCPACRSFFFSGPSPLWGKVRNTYSRKCLNCGLHISGSNVA